MNDAASYTERMAGEVAASVGRVGEELFGQRRAFVSQVYADLQRRGVTHTDLGSFKALLLVLRRAGLVSLGRCDLVGAYAPEVVRESEIGGEGFGAPSWHFVKVVTG